MENWKEIVFGRLGKTFTGLSGKTKDDFGSGMPFITYMNVFSNGKINPSEVDYVQINKDEKQNQVKYGDLFFTTSSETIKEVGMTSVLLDNISETYLNSFCFGFRLNDFETLLPEFVPYLFRSEKVRHQITLKGQGSTRYNLSKTELLEKLVLKIPSKSEQRKIAGILSSTDEAIEQTKKLISKYQLIKTGLMQDLLTKGIDVNGNIRSKATHKFVVKNGIEVPEEWDVLRVEEFATNAKYAIVDGPFGSNLKTIHYRTSGVPIIQSGFVTSQKFEAGEYIYVDKEKFEQERRSKASPGDLIMAKIGANCGTCALLPENHPVSIIAGNSLKITVSNINHNRFLEALFHFYYSIGKFDDIKSTTAQPAISMASLKIMFIPRPSKEEQIKISTRIAAVDGIINAETKNLLKLISLKTGLMQDLLSGKVRVKIKEEQMV